MSRLEKFKQKRILRKRYISAALLFFSILIPGLLSVDYSTNYLMTGNRGLELTAFINKQDKFEISFMNEKIYINTLYLNRDLKRLKNELRDLFGR